MDVIKRHKTTYISGDITLVNVCDGTTNPFEFKCPLPTADNWVDIKVLTDMKKVITRALYDAKKELSPEFVNIEPED